MLLDEGENRLKYLWDNAGPTIRHLLARRFDVGSKRELANNYQALLQLPEVAVWRRRVPVDVSATTLLGSSDNCFENAFGMLVQFGLSIDDILTKDQLSTYLRFLETSSNDDIYSWLARYAVAGYLYISGVRHPEVMEIVANRLNSLFDFVCHFSKANDMYVDGLGSHVPKAYAGKKIINPKLYEDGELQLPLIHDVFIFSYIYNDLEVKQRKQVDQIIAYVADQDYQSLDYGYGVVRSKENKWHAMGWSAHMPLYKEELSTTYFRKGLIFRAGLFSVFENAAVKDWLSKVLNAVEDYKVDENRFVFPSELMPETANSYFLNGRHTSLNENRRQKDGRIIEATYYAHLMGASR